MRMNKEELLKVTGGVSFTTIMNTILRGANFALELGRTLGTYFRRVAGGKVCPL